MKQLFTAIFIMAFPFSPFAQYVYNNLKIDYLESHASVADYSFENLRLYPVRSKQGFINHFAGTGKYMPLKTAIEKNKIRITEKSNSGEVNSLMVENVSADTIIIISGDIIKGGKQDRVINQDILLVPRSGKKNLSVFCVESGRWSSGDRAVLLNTRNSTTGSVKHTSPAQFKTYYNKASVSLRKVVEKDKDQGKVWEKVEELNIENNTQTETKTYTAMTNSAGFNKKLGNYLAFFKNKFTNDKEVIGVVVVSGNKVLGCDMFATHDLFLLQFESLLYSYATEAIVKGAPVTISTAVVKSYTDKLMADEKIQENTLKAKGSSFVEKGKKLRVSSFD